MEYIYNTPEEAIISLENAYTNKDLEAIIKSKDFDTEAKLILKEASYNYDVNDKELINETVELLKTAFIQSLKENGYPSFQYAEREFSELEKIDADIYCIHEKLFFPNNVIYVNKIFLSYKDDLWKVAMIEE